MTPKEYDEFESLNDALRGFDEQLRRYMSIRLRNCVDCIHFDEASEVCSKAGQRPPAKVIARGCELYDDIPF